MVKLVGGPGGFLSPPVAGPAAALLKSYGAVWDLTFAYLTASFFLKK